MLNSVVLTQRNIVRSKSRANSKMLNNEKAVVFLLIGIIALFSILYIVCINSVVTGSYKIQEHKTSVKNLKSENKILGLELSRTKSFSYLEERIEGLNMAKTQKIEYLSPISQVAAK